MSKSYDLHFDFNADSGADFFKNVSAFIASLDELNVAICSYVNSEIATHVILESVENGSLKAKVRDILKSANSDKIRSYVKDPRDAIADLLIMAKDKLIELLDDNPKQLPNKADEIVCEIIESGELKDYGYKRNKTPLLQAMSNLSQSAKGFKMPPRINLKGNEREVKGDYEFSPEDLPGVIEQKSEFKGSFIIKKPDLAGASKWTIINGSAIDVKIIDEAWLRKLKNHEVSLSYGDKIAGTLISNSMIDPDLNVISTDYFLDDILGIEAPKSAEQRNLEIKE